MWLLTDETDERLADRSAAGDTAAFEELVNRHRTRVYRLCYRMAGNADDAADWAQACLVRTYLQLAAYSPARPFTPWLMRVASNTCINLAKSRGRRTAKQTVGIPDDIRSDSSDSDPVRTVIARDTATSTLAAIAELPPLLRQAVTVWALEGTTFRELGEILGVPLTTAATRVRRALIQVNARLAHHGVEAQ